MEWPISSASFPFPALLSKTIALLGSASLAAAHVVSALGLELVLFAFGRKTKIASFFGSAPLARLAWAENPFATALGAQIFARTRFAFAPLTLLRMCLSVRPAWAVSTALGASRRFSQIRFVVDHATFVRFIGVNVCAFFNAANDQGPLVEIVPQQIIQR
jgi:hypothetical protein